MADTYEADLVTIDLNDNTIYRSKANHIIAENDKNANQFGVRIVRDGNPVNLTGVNCTGYFVRHVTDETIVIQGAIDTTDTTRSVAYVKLPQACYAQEGSFSLAINIYGSGTNNIGESVTVRIVDGVVVNTKTTTTLDPSNVVPDITELLAKISAMESATTAAQAVVTNNESRFNSLSGQIEEISELLVDEVDYYWETIDSETEGTTVKNAYVNSSGSLVNNNGYASLCITPEKDGYYYFETTTSFKSGAIYNSSNDLTLVKKFYYENNDIPTKSNPALVGSGQYFVACAKDSASKIRIYKKEQYPLKMKQSLQLTEKMSDQVREMIEKDNSVVSDANTYRKIIPTYYTDAIVDETVAGTKSFDELKPYIDSVIDSIPDGKSFVFITDIHDCGTSGNKNAGKSVDIINYIRAKKGIMDVVYGGDTINNALNPKSAYMFMEKSMVEKVSAFGINFLSCVGNHDTNLVQDDPDLNGSGDTYIEAAKKYAIPYKYVTDCFVNHLKGRAIIRDETERLSSLSVSIPTDDFNDLVEYFRLNYYVDDEVNKIRYIIFNTGSMGANLLKYFGVLKAAENYLHIDWMYETLMSTPKGYDIVCVGHEPVLSASASDGITTTNRSILKLVGMMKTKSKIGVRIGSAETRLVTSGWFTALGTHVFDFTQAPDVGKVFVLGGHWHSDFIWKAYQGESDYIATELPSTERVNQSTGELPLIFTACDEVVNWNINNPNKHRGIGTIDEQIFDIVTLTDDSVVLTRVGYGEKQRIVNFV